MEKIIAKEATDKGLTSKKIYAARIAQSHKTKSPIKKKKIKNRHFSKERCPINA